MNDPTKQLIKIVVDRLNQTEAFILEYIGNNGASTPYDMVHNGRHQLSYTGIAKVSRDLESAGVLMVDQLDSTTGGKKKQYSLSELGTLIYAHMEEL